MKKMKKLLALFLALAMVLALASCSSSGSDDADEDTADDTTTDVSEETEDTEEAETEESTETVEVDALSIEFSTTYQSTETVGTLIQYFVDTLEESSGGQITVNVSWGGTMFDDSSQLDAVSSGAVNMITYLPNGHLDETPLFSVPSYAPGDVSTPVEYYNYLMEENEETAALFAAEAESLGIMYLNVLAGGPDAFCATFSFETLDELVEQCTSFGILASAAYEALGLTCSSVGIADRYDNLDRGIIDATTMTLTAIASMSWFEVAPYVVQNGLYSAGNFFTVNQDWWDSLSEAQQELIQAAADAAEAYSIELIEGDIDSAIETIEAGGGTVSILSDDDISHWWNTYMGVMYEDALARGENLGNTDEIVTVFEAAMEYTGYEAE